MRSKKNPDDFPNLTRRSLLGAVGVSLAAGLIPSIANANDLKIGKMAPPLVLHTLDGHQIATRDLIGKVVIVTFWASWCAPCREELPLLSDYAAKHEADGLHVLGFCLDDPDNIKSVREVATTLSFPVGLLGSPYAGGYGRVWRMPVSFVIDRNGRLADNGWEDSQPVWTAERFARVMDPIWAADKV